MFTLVQDLTFKETVKVRMPVPGGKGFEEKTFTGHFRVLSDEESEAQDYSTLEGVRAYARRILIGWDGIVADDGSKTPVPYSDETREQLIAIPFVRFGIFNAYNAALAGARSGN
ncbi:MAG: hypothetical protein ACK4GW_13265 [Pseudorhodobacter sp.]